MCFRQHRHRPSRLAFSVDATAVRSVLDFATRRLLVVLSFYGFPGGRSHCIRGAIAGCLADFGEDVCHDTLDFSDVGCGECSVGFVCLVGRGQVGARRLPLQQRCRDVGSCCLGARHGKNHSTDDSLVFVRSESCFKWCLPLVWRDAARWFDAAELFVPEVRSAPLPIALDLLGRGPDDYISSRHPVPGQLRHGTGWVYYSLRIGPNRCDLLSRSWRRSRSSQVVA